VPVPQRVMMKPSVVGRVVVARSRKRSLLASRRALKVRRRKAARLAKPHQAQSTVLTRQKARSKATLASISKNEALSSSR